MIFELTKSVKAMLYERLESPFWGAVFVTFCIRHWRIPPQNPHLYTPGATRPQLSSAKTWAGPLYAQTQPRGTNSAQHHTRADFKSPPRLIHNPLLVLRERVAQVVPLFEIGDEPGQSWSPAELLLSLCA
jgi:hypothetical protein